MNRLVKAGVGPEFLLSEANNNRARENIVIGASQTLKAGTLLGMISIGALAAAALAVAGNTGAATITPAPAVAVGTPTGVYTLTAVTAGIAAEWLLESPTGIQLGNVTTGVAATVAGIGPITITDAGVDPAVGDQFTITVTDAAHANEGQYVLHAPAATDGSQIVAGLLYDPVTTVVAQTAPGVAIVRAAEVIASRLVYGVHDAGQKAAAVAALTDMGVIVRT